MDPSRWGKKTEQTVVGDQSRRIAIRPALSPPEVREQIKRLLDKDDLTPEGIAMKALVSSGKRLPPEIYDVA